MNTYVDIAIIIVLLVLLGYIAFAVVTGGAKDQELDAAFGAAQGASGSKAASQMLRFARPLASLDLVQSQKGTSLGKAIAAKLQASGGMYANSVEVFLSVQVLAVLGGIAGALLGFAGVLHPLIAASLAFFVAIIPYQLVDRRAQLEAQR